MTNKNIRNGSYKIKIAELVVLFMMLASFIGLICQTIRLTDFSRPELITNMVLSLTSVFFTILLYYFCVSGYTWDPYQKRMLEIMLFLLFLSTLLIYSTNISVGNPKYNELTMPLINLL